MNLSDKHPAEIEFRNALDEIRALLIKYENKYLDGEDKDFLIISLKQVRDRLFDLQMERFGQYINEKGLVENLPAEEEKLQKEMKALQDKIDRFIMGDFDMDEL